MFDRRAAWSLPGLFAIFSLLAWLIAPRAEAPVEEVARSSRGSSAGPAERRPAFAGHGVRWIVAGGGPTPEFNQIQIEQDLSLAVRVLEPSGAGLLLYAGGPGSASVQVSAHREVDALTARLADLFDPRGGRDATYRRSTLAPVGAASAEAIIEAVRGALPDGRAPLTVVLVGHGDGGEEPVESLFLTWGPEELDVPTLAAVFDEVRDHRPVRIVMTSCYAGGFADIAFTGADPELGSATDDRCGLFATTWDRAASGCDPNPDRGSQEGYGIHFLHALGGRDRDDRDAMRAIDLDRDGHVSLLEAHARARIASRSLDVPATTSERFLRAAAPMPGASTEAPVSDGFVFSDLPPADLPIERAVVAALSERLGLETPSDVFGRLDTLHRNVLPISEHLDELDAQLAWAREELAAELLHRWPVLDDPWHPEFAATLSEEREAILDHLATSGAAGRQDELRDARDEAATAHDELLIDAAPMERLERALETLELAARLQAEGGSFWERYLRFVACEDSQP